MFSILRFIFDCFCILLCWNGIGVKDGDFEILYISGALFRYALLCDCLYFLFGLFLPRLYKKLVKLSDYLFYKDICFIIKNKKCFDE